MALTPHQRNAILGVVFFDRYLDQVDGGAGFTGRPGPGQNVPSDHIPPVFPGTDSGDWLDRSRKLADQWQETLDRKRDNAVFAADEAHFDNEMLRKGMKESAEVQAARGSAQRARNFKE